MQYVDVDSKTHCRFFISLAFSGAFFNITLLYGRNEYCFFYHFLLLFRVLEKENMQCWSRQKKRFSNKRK